MNRRTAIRNVMILSAGAGLLPSCTGDERASVALKNVSITAREERMLAALTTAIIPSAAGSAGASELKAHEFVLTMVDDCLGPDEQKHFQEGLKAFDALCHERSGQLFTSFTPAQKKELLTALESKKDISAAALDFYVTVKNYTLQCFTTSKNYLIGVKNYKMVPGPVFKGCVPVGKA